jgi:uncharacterized protein
VNTEGLVVRSADLADGGGSKPFGGNQMAIRSLASLAAVFTLAVAGGAAAQASFDCSKATTPTELTICGDPGLAAIDRELDAAYQSAVSNAADDRALRASQREWLTDLQLCGEDPYCIEESYADRISILDSFGGSAGEAVETDTVESAPQDEPVVAIPTEDRSDEPSQPQRETQPEIQPGRTLSDQPAPDPVIALKGGGLFFGMILAVAASKALADHTTNKYGWPLIMNWWNLLHFVGAVAGMFVASFGGIMMGLVVFGGCWLVVLLVNITKTNLLTGLAMTIVQPLVVAILWVVYGVTKAKAEGRRI